MAQSGLDIELRKKFQGLEFTNLFELVVKVKEYEELLTEESQQRKTSMGTYYQEVNYEEIIIANLLSTCSLISTLLVKKTTYERSRLPQIHKYNILLMWQRLRKILISY